MATKNLARTVIEGGRSRYNKGERRWSNRTNRRKVREYARNLRYDVDTGDGSDAPARLKIPRIHNDRLAAAERWLASFVGERWDDARSEIARRFDTRTIAGQHIVFDHLLDSVEPAGSVHAPRADFFVDADGILRRAQRRPRRARRRMPPGKVWRPWREIHAWTRGRLVGKRGAVWFWFEPTGWVWKACNARRCRRDHVVQKQKRLHLEPSGRFRQSAALEPDDIRYWAELIDTVQEELAFPGSERAGTALWRIA